MPKRKEIKVLFVTHYRELLGANNSLLQLILELRDMGIIPTVLLPDYEIQAGNDLGLELDKHGIEHREAKIRFDKHPDWKLAVVSYFRTLLFRKSAANAVKGLDFDIIHSNSSTISVGAYLARKLKRPHVWHLREFGNLDYGYKTPFGKWYQKIMYAGNNYFIAISENIKRHFENWTGSQEIRVIYNGIKSSLKRMPATTGVVEICIVGFIRPEKGQMELIEAIDDLVNKRNIRNLHVTVIGKGDDSYEEKIKLFIKEHDLTEFVTIAGRRNDVPELLTKMDIGVMASSHEAFGRVTVEYMMTGLAVVASDGGANKEIVEDGKTGLIYKGGNPVSLSNKLELLIKDPEFREKMAHDGQIYAEENFSSEANSHAIFQLYNDLLNSK